MSHTLLRVHRGTGSSNGAGLIMTATLSPPPAAVARADPQARLDDYCDALSYYLSLPESVIDRILFVDNSDGDLTPLAHLAQYLKHEKDVELISFRGNDHPHQRGKAYGEFKLMDFGLANTTLFSPYDLIWKTTGRLKFLNLPEMAARCTSQPFDVLCDLHDVPWVGSGKWHRHQNMDLRIFAFRLWAYDGMLRDLWLTHESGLDAEFMYHQMRQSPPDVRVVRRFPLQPRLQGISGRHQRDYLSPSQRAKDAVRGMTRRLMPWLWL